MLVPASGCAISHGGLFYYLKQADDGSRDLMRADLENGQVTAVYRLPPGLVIRSLGTVTTDGRYYAGGTMTVMIQHNRGGKYSPDGQLERLVGPEGATLYVLSVPEGRRTELAVGTPHTTACTGHEAWIGTTGEMLLSVSASGEFRPEQGNLLAVRAGQPPRVVARGYRFNHVGASRCGRIFSADDWQPPYQIVIGNTQVERAVVICESKTSPTRSQNTHPHPYVTPDLKWGIFNSNRTGSDHIYAVRIPDERMASLLG